MGGVCDVHLPVTHCSPEAQSELFLQLLPAAHAAQVPPPQSMSVSAPFF
jgi:hypothetical protein